MNKVMLRGNLGNDPELRTTGDGKPVCNFRLATNERFRDQKGEQQTRTEWHRITVWGKTAENCARYLKKGREVFLEGALRTRKWKDRDGNDRYTTEIHTVSVDFGRRPRGEGEGGGEGGDDGYIPEGEYASEGEATEPTV